LLLAERFKTSLCLIHLVLAVVAVLPFSFAGGGGGVWVAALQLLPGPPQRLLGPPQFAFCLPDVPVQWASLLLKQVELLPQRTDGGSALLDEPTLPFTRFLGCVWIRPLPLVPSGFMLLFGFREPALHIPDPVIERRHHRLRDVAVQCFR
jgi:hypothetical protein